MTAPKPDKTEYSVSQRTLERIRLGCQIAFSPLALESVVEVEEIAGRMIIARMRGYLWGESIGRQSVAYPSDWWQHFKQRWFPTRILRRWPVQMTTKHFVVKALYPDYRPVFPNQRVHFLMQKEFDARQD